MRQQDFGSLAQVQSKAAASCSKKQLRSPRNKHQRCAMCTGVGRARRRLPCDQPPSRKHCVLVRDHKREGALLHTLPGNKPQAGCRRGVLPTTPHGKSPKQAAAAPGLPPLLLRSWLAGLMPSSYVSWTPLWTRLLQFLDGCAGNFFSRHGFVWEMRKMLAARARRRQPRTGPRDFGKPKAARPPAPPTRLQQPMHQTYGCAGCCYFCIWVGTRYIETYFGPTTLNDK